MALKLLDGFDYYDTVNLSRKWDYVRTGSVTVGAFGRRSSQGVRVSGTFQTIGQAAIGKNLPATNASWGFFGSSWNAASMPGDGHHVVHSVYDIASSGGMKLCTMVGADGSLAIGYVVVNNFSTVKTILASSAPGVITAGTTYLESGFKINSTVGGCIFKVAGTSPGDAGYLSYTGNTVRSSGSNVYPDSSTQQFTHVRLGGDVVSGSSPNVDMDDFYYCDDTGSRNNSFLGNLGIYTIYSNALGDVSDWTRTGAASDILAVNEHPVQDDDAGYMAATVVGRQFLHHLDGIVVSSGVVAGAGVNHAIKQDDTGVRGVKALLKTGSIGSGTPYTTPSSYANRQAIFETSPSTGTAITLAEVATLQAGGEVTT